jgi:hypothetical protein
MSQPKKKRLPRHGKYKVTLKIWDENDRLIYVRLPPKSAWFVVTSSGCIDPTTADQIFKMLDQKGAPEGKWPVFNLPQKD